jgi:ABC-2 type transport system ATP-binding protein
MSAAVQVRNLEKVFQAKQKAPGLGGSVRALFHPEYREIVAVRGVSFEMRRGEMVAFIGPNGAGKSTTIKMLTGILFPSGGEASVLGLVPWKQREQLTHRMGVVFGQRSQLWYHLPPIDSFELLASIYELDRAPFRARLSGLVDRFEIGPHLNTPVRKLSLGERMRCEFVGCLLHRPEVLFLDEPTIGLDVVVKQHVRELIRHLNKEEQVTVFLTSHDAGDVESLCERVIVINDGSVIFDDSVAALKQQHIHSRTIELKLTEPGFELNLAGVTTHQVDEYAVTLEVDTEQQAVEAVVGRAVASGRVADLTIQEPPLEQIIARIYRGTA